jgi:hypothetical protein
MMSLMKPTIPGAKFTMSTKQTVELPWIENATFWYRPHHRRGYDEKYQLNFKPETWCDPAHYPTKLSHIQNSTYVLDRILTPEEKSRGATGSKSLPSDSI